MGNKNTKTQKSNDEFLVQNLCGRMNNRDYSNKYEDKNEIILSKTYSYPKVNTLINALGNIF